LITESNKSQSTASHRMISLLDRMIAWDILQTVSAVLVVLVVIIVSRKFIKILALAIDGTISSNTAMNIFGLKTLVVIVDFLPVAIFISILMVLGRMYRDHEMTVIASAGGGVMHMYKAIFICVLPLSLLTGILSFYVSPWSEAQMVLLTHHDQQEADLRGLSAGSFIEYSHGDLVFYTQEIDSQQQMQQIFIQNRQHGKLGVISAQTGKLVNLAGGKYAVLANSERNQGIAGEANFSLETFAEYGVRIQKKSTNISYGLETTESNKLFNSDEIADQVEFMRRAASPLGIIFLSFLAVPLAKLSPRSGVYGSLLFAFIIYFIYSNISQVNYSWLLSEILPIWLGYIWVYGLLSLLGIILIIRLYGLTWMLQNLRGSTHE